MPPRHVTGKILTLPTKVHTGLVLCPFVLSLFVLHPSALIPLANSHHFYNLHPLILGLTIFGWLGSKACPSESGTDRFM
jgi:hypothetical protein